MSRILIVDDRAENRSFLVTLLGYGGHQLLEAQDGQEGLAVARAHRPDLIITDVLMPTMDGYEFVRTLRGDSALAQIPVIFTTAHYLDREATALANACGVEAILPKPSEPQTVLDMVDAALGGAHRAAAPPRPSDEDFDREHGRLVFEKLRQKTDELRALNEKTAALVDLIQRGALERDPERLLGDFCDGARRIVGAQVASLFVTDGPDEARRSTSGLVPAMAAAYEGFRSREGPLAVLIDHPGSLRMRPPSPDPRSIGLPAGHPPVLSVTAASVMSPTQTYGWLCLTNKLGFPEFDDDDERLIRILAAQLGRMYENGKLYKELQRRTVALEHEIQERRRSEARFRSLIENATDLISALDADGRLAYVSPSHERVFGYAPGEFIGRNAFENVFHEDRPRVAAAMTGLFAKGGTVKMEFRTSHRDGSWRVIEAIAANLLHDPAVGSIVINSRDVTDRKKAEERTAILLKVATAIQGTIDYAEAVERVQRQVATALPCDFVVTLERRAETESLRVVSTNGIPAHQRSFAQALEISANAPIARALAGGETIDVAAALPGDPLLDAFELAHAVAAPLRTGDVNRGILLGGRSAPARPFEREDLELCSGIAAQLAVAMEVADLYRRHQEEAEVAGSLARAGEDLIASLDRAGLLDRICDITTEVLACDASWTLLRDAQTSQYTPVATAGVSAEQAEEIRLLPVSPQGVALLTAALASEGVLRARGDGASATWDPVPTRLGCDARLYVPLRRGSEIIGVLAAGHRDDFSTAQERIARRLAHLASLALEAARLIENLEAANRLKSDFVATISHELRTPMNIIMGYNDLLREDAYGPLNEEQRRAFVAMDKNARQLLELINATLDLSRLEAGRLPLSPADVDLREIFTAVRAELRHLDRPGVEVEMRLPRTPPRLRTDPVKLKIILKNLVHNGMKFTDQGSVVLAARRAGAGVEFTVTDTGIGIAAASIDEIFEPFRQIEAASTRQYGGVGLGLYLVRRLADLLGGEIDVESELGRGSTFRLWVPNVAAADERPA